MTTMSIQTPIVPTGKTMEEPRSPMDTSKSLDGKVQFKHEDESSIKTETGQQNEPPDLKHPTSPSNTKRKWSSLRSSSLDPPVKLDPPKPPAPDSSKSTASSTAKANSSPQPTKKHRLPCASPAAEAWRKSLYAQLPVKNAQLRKRLSSAFCTAHKLSIWAELDAEQQILRYEHLALKTMQTWVEWEESKKKKKEKGKNKAEQQGEKLEGMDSEENSGTPNDKNEEREKGNGYGETGSAVQSDVDLVKQILETLSTKGHAEQRASSDERAQKRHKVAEDDAKKEKRKSLACMKAAFEPGLVYSGVDEVRIGRMPKGWDLEPGDCDWNLELSD